MFRRSSPAADKPRVSFCSSVHTCEHYHKRAFERFFSNLPIKWKINLTIMITSAIALLFAALAFTVNDIITFRMAAVVNLTSMTKVIGHNSLGALAFDDPDTAAENLSALGDIPFVVSAFIFDKDQNIFAQFVREGRSVSPDELRRIKDKRPQGEGHFFRHHNLYLFQPIFFEAKQLGSVLIHYDLKEMYQRIKKTAYIVLVIVILVLLIALTLSAKFQRIISEPILNLVATARSVTLNRDYSARAVKCSHDELGALIDDFNVMLAEIQLRDEELKRHREHLEEEVARRTLELRQVNENLIEAKEAADMANMAKSEFLANMSHEIRTPMNAVLGFTELLNQIITEPKQKNYLESIRSGGKNLLTLINDILDLSKIEAGRLEIQYEPVNAKSIFAEIHSIFSLKIAEKGLDLIINISPDIPDCLLLDEVRLRQVLFNLIGNAVKFTEKGFIKLSACREVREDDDSKLDLIIMVEDTGIGIAEHSLASIFDAFRQQDGQSTKRYGGTGLGLAISKRLIEMMKGAIRVYSQVGQGSRFEIVLHGVSLAAAPIKTAEDAQQIDANIRFSPAKLLVVDDIEVNRSLIIAYFQDTEIKCLEAENGDQALHTARFHQPDVMLMDIRMPIMDGYEATRQIKSDPRTAHIPVIALTASGMKKDREKSMQYGFDGFLIKPVKKIDLMQELMKYLSYTRLTPAPKPAPDPACLQLTADEGHNPEQLTEVIQRLEDEFMEKWKVARNSGFFEEMEKFGLQIGEIGQHFKIGPCIEFGQELKQSVDSFDVETINKVMDRYPALIAALKAQEAT